MKYEVIFCVVNAGYSELVMDAAREVGAKGGTVMHAKGTANKEAEKFFNIAIQPDKEIVMILVPQEIKDDVLHAIYRQAGLKSEGSGIAFSMPVNAAVGARAESYAEGGDKDNKDNDENKDNKPNSDK